MAGELIITETDKKDTYCSGHAVNTSM